LTGNVPAAGPSRRRPPPDAASTSKPTVQAPLEKSRSKADITREKSKIVVDKPKDKPKPTGKLNFAKARAKEPKDEPEAKQDQKESLKAASTSDSKIKESKSKEEPRKDEKSKEEVKVLLWSCSTLAYAHGRQRGTKRKSLKALMSESEDDKSSIPRSKSPSESHSNGNVRVNGRMVLSDDSDVDSSPHPRMLRMSLRAQNTIDSEAERDLKALMDIDDGTRVSFRIFGALFMNCLS
jgi:DNA polymerase delta subunit 3